MDVTNAENGVGDISAVNDVVESITNSDSDEPISTATTQSILGAVSNVVTSDITVTADQEEEANDAKKQ